MLTRSAGLLLLLLAPRLALAADPAASAAVRDALAGIESVPGADRVLAIPGAESALQDLARDRTASATLRARAVVMLGEFRSASTVTLLEQLVIAPGTPEPLRTRAPLALVRTAGSRALPALSGALAAENPFVRAATARALLQLGEHGRGVLRSRIPLERDPRVLSVLRKAVSP